VGYNCPDGLHLTSYSGFTLYAWRGTPVTSVSNTCVENAAYVGFSRQVINAAWLFTFDRHRSEGQQSWHIDKPNWDNSDDLGFCYSGPMTQGTFAVCPSGSAAYYDGYYTIDNTAVHMDNGATAALYHYTPHKHGQLLFFDTFTGWFGTTQSTELVRTTQDPTVYLLSNGTKYPVSSYQILNDVGTFGPVSYVSQSLLDSFTTGSVMNQSVKSASSATIYFIDDGHKYAFPSCEMMVDYGLYCGGEITLTEQQISQFSTGSSMSNLVHSNGKDFYVKADNKRQIFDATSLQQAGITGDYINLGPDALYNLPLSTPVIRDNVVAQSNLTGTYYFYAAGQLVSVPGDLMATSAFSTLTKKILDSASLNTLPIDRSFTGFMQSSGGTDYVIDQQGKVTLSNAPAWGAHFVTFNDTFLNQIPSSAQPINSMFVKTSSSPTIYMVVDGKKSPILSWTDFINLHTDKSMTFSTLADSTVNSLPIGTGLVAPGTLIKSPDSVTVYIVNSLFQKNPMRSFDVSNDLGIKYYIVVPTSVVDNYNAQSGAATFVTCGGKDYVGNRGLLYEVTPQIATQYGWTSAVYNSWDAYACRNISFAGQALPEFIKTADSVTIYQVKDGVKHPIGSYATYVSLGGSSANTLIVSDYFSRLIELGSVLP
jgi:hypothetical protein